MYTQSEFLSFLNTSQHPSSRQFSLLLGNRSLLLQEVGQRCPRLRHALLHRLPTPDRLVRDHVPHPRLDVEQNPFQDLLDHRSSPLAPVPRSKAILAIS